MLWHVRALHGVSIILKVSEILRAAQRGADLYYLAVGLNRFASCLCYKVMEIQRECVRLYDISPFRSRCLF